MSQTIATGTELFTLGWSKGNDIYIDGKKVDSRTLRNNKDTYQFVREEDKTAVSRNIYYKSHSIQTGLWGR